jgi:hypothetical protein
MLSVASNLDVSGVSTLSSTLIVHGRVVLQSGLSVASNVDVSGNLTVTSHVQFSNARFDSLDDLIRDKHKNLFYNNTLIEGDVSISTITSNEYKLVSLWIQSNIERCSLLTASIEYRKSILGALYDVIQPTPNSNMLKAGNFSMSRDVVVDEPTWCIVRTSGIAKVRVEYGNNIPMPTNGSLIIPSSSHNGYGVVKQDGVYSGEVFGKILGVSDVSYIDVLDPITPVEYYVCHTKFI